MENKFVIAFLFMFALLCSAVVAIQCSSGERVHKTREGDYVCVPCEKYSFVAKDNHSYRTCRTCTFIENHDVEVFVRFCNRTHDSVILCTSGFYRRRARNDQEKDSCEKCTECEFPTRACEGYYDTVCCHPNQEAVLTSGDVYVCRDIPIVCGPGQFFSTSTEECLPCPLGTFMSAHNHTYKDCLKCEQLSENNAIHAVITRPCSRTAPTLFGCKDGYFRDPTQESLQTEVPCTPCRSCQLSLTECGMFHDAVCDVQDTMSSAAPANTTQSTGVFVDADNMTDVTFLRDDTLDGIDRMQLKDAVMAFQKHALNDVVTLSIICVTLFVNLSTTLCRMVWNEKSYPTSDYCKRIITSSRCSKHRIVTYCVNPALSIALSVCILFKTFNTQISDVVTDVFVVITLSADKVYIPVITLALWVNRRPNQRRGKENDDSLVDDQLERAIKPRLSSQDTHGKLTEVLIHH